MRFLRTLWFLLALALVCLVYVLGAGSHLYACMAWHLIRRDADTAHRRRLGIWMMDWSERLLVLFCALMRITLDVRLPDRRPSAMPVILIANHRGSVDTPLLPLVLRRLGYRCALAGIAKRSFKCYPLIGHAVRALRWAFVERRTDEETPEEHALRLERDIKRVTACAEGARGDNACMLIYPEGTLFKKPVPGSGLHHTLPPKVGGIATICGHCCVNCW